MWQKWTVVVFAMAVACSDGGGAECGPGTLEFEGACIVDPGVTCGTGTHQVGSECVADGGVTCGVGTHLDGGACVPDPGGLSCGAGTHASGGACLPDSVVTCGAGTHLAGTTCVPDAVPVTCGPGTHASGSTCVPDDPSLIGNFQLRVVSPQVAADGYSKVPVLAIGTNPDGTPATAAVVFTMSRAGAGGFAPPTAALGPLGTTVYFTPCNATTPGCTGPLTLGLALASAPGDVLASVTVDLHVPTGVGTAAPCLVGGNVMFFDGHDFIYNGMLTVTQGTWNVAGAADHLAFDITPAGMNQGLWWSLDFDTTQLPIDLGPGVYDMAERYPFMSPQHPGLSISGDGRGCNTLTGRFQVHRYEVDPAGVVAATVSFEQHCEGGANALLGCVHYHR